MSPRRILAALALVLASLSACSSSEPTVEPKPAGGGGGGAGGMMPEMRVPLPEVQGFAGFEDKNPDPRIVEVDLVARGSTLSIAPGKETALLTYNGQLPGPLLHARVGDRVIVHFKNELEEPTTVHWHGLRISDAMDGSPMIMSPVEPGQSFTYDFVVPDAGTFWYHTHLHQIEQFERGLYGAIVVHESEFPVFSAERLFVVDDVRLDSNNQIAPFQTSGPDIGAGRTGNTLLVNGKVAPSTVTIAHGAIERWRLVLATNALAIGLRTQGADARVIATDGGLLPERFTLERVEVAPGQRYELEVRPLPNATELLVEAMVLTLDANGKLVEEPITLVRAKVEGDLSMAATEPEYPAITLPKADVDAEALAWKISGGLVNNKVVFTIDGKSTFVGDHEHPLLHQFVQNAPVKITLSSDVSPGHPFHVHGQFFQILARNGKPVVEPGLRDTVHVRGNESVTVLSYFENPGRWMVHCHISEHNEHGMMGEIDVGDTGH